MRRCVIIASQPVEAGLARYIRPGDFVIAADAGWRQAQRLGVQPDVALGDFDSAPRPTGLAEVLPLPAEKDDTDTFFAAKLALQRGCNEVTILGGLGGRFDHSMANLQVLLYLARHSAACLLADEHTEIYCLGPGTLRLPAQPGCYLSVFAAGGPAKGVTLRGVKYPLDDATLTPDFPLGVSNEFAAECAEISCETGYLYVMVAQEAARDGE